MGDGKLSFRVQELAEKGEKLHGRWKDPTWHKVEVENAECPICLQQMTVILGDKSMLYAHCTRCQQYFVGE